MGKRDEIMFGSVTALIELQGKKIIEIWQNLDGIEFVYTAENENKT